MKASRYVLCLPNFDPHTIAGCTPAGLAIHLGVRDRDGSVRLVTCYDVHPSN